MYIFLLKLCKVEIRLVNIDGDFHALELVLIQIHSSELLLGWKGEGLDKTERCI